MSNIVGNLSSSHLYSPSYYNPLPSSVSNYYSLGPITSSGFSRSSRSSRFGTVHPSLSFGQYAEAFAAEYSKACYGVLNTMLGGLFKKEYGLPYMLSDRVRNISKGRKGGAFRSGQLGWRVAEIPLLIAGGLMARSISGPQYKWFRTHVLSIDTTPHGGNVITIGGKLKYVGKHAAKGIEVPHSRQIMWGKKSLIKW